MSEFRQRVEDWFGALARGLYRNPVKTLAIVGVAIIALLSQLPRITIDTSTEGFMRPDDPAMVAYNRFRDRFGEDEVVIVAVQPPEVFDLSFLRKLEALHRELETSVPFLHDITSLVNARNTRGEEDSLIVEDLLEEFPQSAEDMASLRRRVLSNPLYVNLLISEDARFTTIVLEPEAYSQLTPASEHPDGEAPPYLTDDENAQLVEAVLAIAAKYDKDDFSVWVAGSPVVAHFIKRSMMRDMRKFLVLAVAAIAVCLLLMFRRLSGLVLPLLLVILTLLSTIALMAARGTAIKVPTQILPSFLLAVGVGAAVHILAMFYQQLRSGKDKEEAVVAAVGHSGLAVLMTSLTTAAGLFSFSTADVAPIADLGIFAGSGVLVSFVYTIVLLPALLSIAPIRVSSGDGIEAKVTATDQLMAAIARLATGYPKSILAVSAVIVIASLAGAAKVRFSHYPKNWLSPDNAVRLASEKIDEELKGSIALEVVIDAGAENELYEPDLLRRIESSSRYLETLEDGDLFVGKAVGITTILKEINRALNENRGEFYAVPDDRTLVAQEFLLFEMSGSDDLENVVDSLFSTTRLTLKLPFVDALVYDDLLREIRDHFATVYPDVDVTLTGLVPIFTSTLTNVMTSMVKSYVVALVVITLLMIALIGRFRIGLLSMIPNLFPILVAIGIMGWLDIPMSVFTMLVGSIAIGLAVDDTIHFMHNFRRYYEDSGDPRSAIAETLHTTGRAMLVTSSVLCVGFFVFMFASMSNVKEFGFLTGVAIFVALLADYLISPALLVLATRERARPA